MFGGAIVEAGVIVGAALHLEEVDAALVVQDGLGVRADEEDGVVDLDLGVCLVGEEALRGRRGDGRAGLHLENNFGDNYRVTRQLESYILLQSIWGVLLACGPLLQLATAHAGKGNSPNGL